MKIINLVSTILTILLLSDDIVPYQKLIYLWPHEHVFRMEKYSKNSLFGNFKMFFILSSFEQVLMENHPIQNLEENLETVWLFSLQISWASFGAEAAGAADISAFRSLRTLRALRPLRAISRWQGMKVG